MRLRLILSIAAYLVFATSLHAADRPNIVVILADDFGWGTPGCYGANPDVVKTPNIDRLAKEGRRFTDANTTSSVCSPTRYSLLTGRYCWRTSLQHEVLGVFSPLHIEPGRFNLASLLKSKGYSTAAIGKWHLGYGTDSRVDYTKELKPGPLEIGFDYHFGVPSNHGDVTGVFVENHQVWGLRSPKVDRASAGKNFKNTPYLGIDAPQRVDEDVMPLLTTRATEWISKQSADKPFFLYYTPVATHNPVTPSKATKGSSKAGPFGDWVHELDASIGKVLETLDQKGFTQNTLVLFTADNGGVFHPEQMNEQAQAIHAGLKPNGPFRGGKHDVWEGGFRVPYLVRWPGHVPAGTTCDETLSVVDTVATIAAVVDEPLPARDKGAEDSFNMLPAWLGAKTLAPQRPHLIVHAAAGTFAIRQGPWKWIEGNVHPDTKPGARRQRADQLKPQLYNLSSDIGEQSEASAENKEKAAELQTLLQKQKDQGFSRP